MHGEHRPLHGHNLITWPKMGIPLAGYRNEDILGGERKEVFKGQTGSRRL